MRGTCVVDAKSGCEELLEFGRSRLVDLLDLQRVARVVFKIGAELLFLPLELCPLDEGAGSTRGVVACVDEDHHLLATPYGVQRLVVSNLEEELVALLDSRKRRYRKGLYRKRGYRKRW